MDKFKLLYKYLYEAKTLQNAFRIMQDYEDLTINEFKQTLNYIYELFLQGVLL